MSIGRIDSSSSTANLLALDQQLCTGPMLDPGAEIAALLVLSARDSRDLANAAEQAEEQNLRALEDEQVAELYAQAAATRSAGELSALGQAFASGTELAGALCSANGAAGAGAALKPSGAFVKGGFDYAAAGEKFQADMHGADATQAANRGRHAERELQDLKDEQRDAAQLVRSAIDSAAELMRTKNATDQATLFLRA